MRQAQAADDEEDRRYGKDKRGDELPEELGRGPVGKTAVVGAKDRETGQVTAKVAYSTDAPTLQGFVYQHTEKDAQIYTDDALEKIREAMAALEAEAQAAGEQAEAEGRKHPGRQE